MIKSTLWILLLCPTNWQLFELFVKVSLFENFERCRLFLVVVFSWFCWIFPPTLSFQCNSAKETLLGLECQSSLHFATARFVCCRDSSKLSCTHGSLYSSSYSKFFCQFLLCNWNFYNINSVTKTHCSIYLSKVERSWKMTDTSTVTVSSLQIVVSVSKLGSTKNNSHHQACFFVLFVSCIFVVVILVLDLLWSTLTSPRVV